MTEDTAGKKKIAADQAFLGTDRPSRFVLHLRAVSNPPILDVHLADHCNLNCAGCNHFAPVAARRFLPLDQYARDLGLLSRIPGIDGYFSELCLMGGEPLLHPEVSEAIRLSRRFLPGTTLALVTNGILLDRMPPDFWAACRDTQTAVSVTRYPVEIPYDSLACLARETGVQIHMPFVPGESGFFRVPLDPEGRCDPEDNFRHCPSGGFCMQLRGGRLYPCHRSAWRDALNSCFGTNFAPEEGDFLDLRRISSTDEIEAFRTAAKPACRYCCLDRSEVIPWRRSRGAREEWLV